MQPARRGKCAPIPLNSRRRARRGAQAPDCPPYRCDHYRSAHGTDSSDGEPLATAFRKHSNIQKHSRFPTAVRLLDSEIVKRHRFHIRALMMPFRIERFALSRCLYEKRFISVVDLYFSYPQQQTLGVLQKNQLLQEIE